jgi:hypothetical protein
MGCTVVSYDVIFGNQFVSLDDGSHYVGYFWEDGFHEVTKAASLSAQENSRVAVEYAKNPNALVDFVIDDLPGIMAFFQDIYMGMWMGTLGTPPSLAGTTKFEAPLAATGAMEVTGERAVLRSVGDGVWESRAGLRYGPGSPQGNRVRHVLEHAADNPARAGRHGVFDAGRRGTLDVIDEAWIRAQAGGPGVRAIEQGGRTVYEVEMGRRVGFVGGEVGAATGYPAATSIRLVIEGSRDVITAFPF